MTESHEIDCCRPREGDIGSEDLRHHRAGESVCLSVCVFLCSRLRVRQVCVSGISGEEAQGELFVWNVHGRHAAAQVKKRMLCLGRDFSFMKMKYQTCRWRWSSSSIK